MKNLIYLASPHSHTLSAIREDRYKEALKCTSYLIENGHWVFSPIVHSHNLPLMLDQSKIKWEFWKEFDTDTIRRCDEVWILMIPGTKESVGVKAEFEIAKEMKKKVKILWQDSIKSDAKYLDYDVTEWDWEKVIGEDAKTSSL